MKPDEHKKKKNEQYKKKHGIKTAKQKNDSSDGQHRFKGRSQTTENLKTSQTSAYRKDLPKEEEGEEDETVVHRKFERRKVESNWHRYELEKESIGGDSNEGQQGADFQQLLSQTASSSSQFRFKEEQIWENEDTADEPINALSINCEDILSAAICVPLHQRLNIGSEYFEESHLKIIEDYAEQNKLKQCDISDGSRTDEEPAKTLTSGHSKPSVISLEQNDELSSVLETVSDDELNEILNEDAREQILFVEKEEQSTSNKLDLTSPVNEKSEDEVLDELLGFSDKPIDSAISENNVQQENEQKKRNTQTENAAECKIQTEKAEKKNVSCGHAMEMTKSADDVVSRNITSTEVSLEDQLDELLGLDSDNEKLDISSSQAEKTKTSSHAECNRKPTESSLEDWLDSVLDD